MEKKVIKQEKQTRIEVESFTENHITISQHGILTSDEIVIEKTKTREIALAICPELQSELEKAKELLKRCKAEIDSIDWCNELSSEITTFLEGSGNKNK